MKVLFYPEKVIQDKKKSLKSETKQGTTQKKYQDILDIILSAQASLPNI